MRNNSNLHKARKARADEFYTQYEDIEKEIQNYNLEGKKICCNCDDYRYSNFVKYFKDNFNKLKISYLTASNYDIGECAYKYEYDGVEEKITALKGNGDFRSEECVELLKEADVVITNPPFSLLREYIVLLIKYDKKFIIIGNGNAVTYKEIFPLIKENKMWIGASKGIGGQMHFLVPDTYQNKHNLKNEKGETLAKINTSCWFTNIEHNKRNEPIVLYKKYSEEEYPKYDNYDAIECGKVADIPMDYDGVIGVPITFLDKYCPEQFEIVELGNSRENFTPIKDYVNPIKHKKDGTTYNGNAINCVLAIEVENKPTDVVYYTTDNSKYLIAPYARIIIRKKH